MHEDEDEDDFDEYDDFNEDNLDDDEASGIRSWVHIDDPLEGKPRHALQSLPGTAVVLFKPHEQVCAVIVVDSEDAPYRGLVRNVAEARTTPSGMTFRAAGRTLEVALYEPVPEATMEALVGELAAMF